ncbi:LuxR family transcriptional regulator [Polaribacter sp. SA4-10]|nr:LuxR family transcriptional regulator [Polaribacter sp. SA4-10]
MCLVFFSKLVIIGQELPPVNVFTTKQYGAEKQNWAISQAENKFIYVANNKGLLEYNGANWQLYETPNETIMRSVRVVGDNIFTGFYMDFGFWKKNNFGSLEYTSIVKNKNIKMLEDEHVWNILELDGWVLFKSLERIYLYNLETNVIKIINADNKITKISKIDDVIYFQELNKGIFKIENGIPKLISENKILKENIVVEIFKKEDTLLFLTQKKGFFFLRENRVVNWVTPSDANILNKTIYSAKQLKNKDFVLGTISDGIIYLNNNGEINYKINHVSGLSNNTVLSVFEDIDDNIWLGLDNGINTINNTSPLKISSNKNHFLGTVYTSIVFDNTLYLGTNQGLFFQKMDTDMPFKLIENTEGQVWNLIQIDNSLFCGHDSGIFIIDKEKANKISNIQGVWDVKKLNETTLILGSYDGLYVLTRAFNNWKIANKIKGFTNSSRYFVIEDKFKIFVNHEYKGIFKLTIDKNYQNVINISKEESIKRGTATSLIKYKQDIFYASKKGIFKYNKPKDTFVIDTIYSKLISNENFSSARLIYNAVNDKLWSFSKQDVKFLTSGKLSSKPIIKSIPISESSPKGATGFENIIHFKNKKQLIGTSDGYITLDLNKIKEPKDFIIGINKINSFKLGQPKNRINLSQKIEFENKENNIEFSYSVTNYNKILTSKYQYQLLGQKKQWSIPSESNSILFENISYGDYTFKVRGIVGNKLSTNEAVFSFRIHKPWYLSNFMVTIYVLLYLLLFYLIHNITKRYYRRQREKLLENAKKELDIKELESSQKIIKLNNDKLRSDIESKNRELASSTMSIIKKNEFLNTIKTELIKGGEMNIVKVVRIIDKDLNNTDDWAMFQEAFNNADKKFLKKVKSKHPELTPNDLRLCAYLRLNLSSKEIAPLLNISPRSVEVKRYRLRKKMGLPHDSNLTNYILEI